MNFRSIPLRRAVASLPCANCGLEGYSQCAHSNLYEHGKGRSLKSSDAATFPLCSNVPGRVGCHEKFDQHLLCTKAEAAELTARFIAETHIKLLERGLVRVA
jgi:hypothetical protein